jgi:hypothetical protein
MYEKSKTNLDNVLQKIKANNLPFILLLLILIIIILVTIVSDYFSFSKSKSKFEGFDTLNDNRIPDNIDVPRQQEIPKSENDSQIPSVGDEELLNDYRSNYPEDYDQYKKQYDQYKKESDKYKNDSDNINKISNELKDYNKENVNNSIDNYIDNYETSIKNELVSAVNNQATNAKNKIPSLNISIPTIKDPKISNSIIVVSFILIALILCFVFIPGFSDFKNLFNQISSVTYVILYTIFLILFLRLLPSNIMNSNAYYIVPITIIIAVFLFILGFRTNYATDFNVNYERIKMIILYFCFITICITYYSVNPGDYITKNLNISSLFAVLIGIFGFIYLIVLLTLPENYNIFSSSNSSGIFNNSSNPKNITNALTNMSSFSKYGGIGFVLFLVIMTTVIATYPGGFFKNTKSSTIIVMVLFLIISIIWSILLVVNMFTGFNSNAPSGFMDSNLTYAKKTLLALLGFTLSGIIIAYIVYNVQNLSGRSCITSFILSIFLIISILILIYKTIFVKLPSNNATRGKNGFFDLIVNLIFYIPCLFSGVFDGIMKTLVGEYKSTTPSNVLILIIMLVLLLLYIYLPTIQHTANLQGGKQLVENPIYTNTMHSLANYIQLNGSDSFDYQYSISFWVFIDSNAPNTNPSYNQYTSLLNYGGKPNILYNAKTNTLMITMEQKNLDKESKNKLLEFDDNGNRIIYTNTNVLLQKWNNIIIQFNGGTLDIFLNGELVKSSIEVIPYMSFDTLTIGSDGGVNGGICNVVYYKNPLAIANIYYIYRNVKDKNPPVIQKSNNTIIPPIK